MIAPAKFVVVRVKNHRLKRRLGVARRRRHALDDRDQQFVDSHPGLAAARQHFVRIDPQHRLHFGFDFFRSGMLQVDLVQHRHDRQVVLHRRIGIGHGLGLDPLERIDHQQRPLAASQAARNFVLKVDVPRRVDQVQLVLLALIFIMHRHGAGFDGDSPLPLQVHVVEHLLAQFSLFDRAGLLQQPIGQRTLAVVDVGDDRKIANVLAVRHKRFLYRGCRCRGEPLACIAPVAECQGFCCSSFRP